jgi:hypothetical protein
MAVNLLEMIKQGLPGNFSDMAGKLVGESPGATQTALSAALPALLGSIAQKGATTDGAQSVLSLLDSPAVNTGALGNLAGLLSGGEQSNALLTSGSGLLTSLLGDKFGALAGSLASIAGLKNSQSASNLLALLAPIVLGFIKKFVGDKGLGASGLASLLGSQGQFLQGALDKRLTSALGFQSPSAMLSSLGGKAEAAMGAAGAAIGSAGAAIGSAGAAIGSAGAAAAATAQRAGTHAPDMAADASRGARGWMRWLPWVIAAIVLLFVLSRLSTCSQPAEKSATPPPATSTAPAATPPPATSTAPAATPPPATSTAPAATPPPAPSPSAPAPTPAPSTGAPSTEPSPGAATTPK